MTKLNAGLGRRRLLKAMATSATITGSSMLSSCAKDGKSVPVTAADRTDLQKAVSGKVFWPGDPSYERERGSTCYRMNKPKRFPGTIVQPLSDKDVVAAVRFAKRHGMEVTTRSGGHSWSASHIRDKCLLIDMSRMQDLQIDPKAKTLWTNPGVIGSRINAELDPHGLIVPTAHHPSPGIGGFCMNGGFGWNSRLWGNGAAHLIAIDVVTADGELIRADEHQNTDFLWAARGSGAGFFGVITRMKLRCNDRPKVMKVSAYGFTADAFDELFAWARNVADKIPPYLEFVMTSTAHDPKTDAPSPVRLTLAGLALTDDEAMADAALDILATCPCLDKATFKAEKKPTTLDERYTSGYAADPAGYRFAADNIYTNAPAEVLVPKIKDMFLNLPTPRTHVFWLTWGPTKPFPKDMALSIQGDIYIGAYTIWSDPKDDARLEAWPVARMKELDDISVGAQMNDENMLHHQQDYLSHEAYLKVERMRLQHDPEHRFASWLGKPVRDA